MNSARIRTQCGPLRPTNAALLLVFALVAVVLSGCAAIFPVAPPTPVAAAATSALLAQLPNLAYPMDVAPDGVAQLAKGAFSAPAAPGSATNITVALGEQQASGDLTGDGIVDAVTTLVAEPGGSGTFVYLAAVLDQAGVGKAVPALLLGDRITVSSIAIVDQQIVVNLLTRKDGEAMASPPTEPATQIYMIENNRLVLVG